jgi:hypothetical protein
MVPSAHIQVPLAASSSLKGLQRSIFLVGFILLTATKLASASQGLLINSDSSSANQVLFEAASAEVSAGRYVNAIAIYQIILGREDSVRVRLEIAQSYYLSGQLDVAKEHFQLILNNYELPAMVESRVLHYLEQIKERNGKLSIGFNLVSNSNPKNVTYEDQVIVLGQKLTVVKSKKSPKTSGINLSLGYDRMLPPALTADYFKRSDGYFSSNIVQYQNGGYRSVLLDGGVTSIVTVLGDSAVMVGAATLFEDDIKVYDSYYTSLSYSLNTSPTSGMTHKVTLSKADISSSTFYDSITLGYELSGVHKLKLGSLQWTLGIDKSKAAEEPYSYIKRKGSIKVSDFSIGMLDVSTELALSVKQNNTIDPMFGSRRMDGNLSGEILISIKDLRIVGLVPKLGFSREHNLSTINLYNYKNQEVYLKFSN